MALQRPTCWMVEFVGFPFAANQSHLSAATLSGPYPVHCTVFSRVSWSWAGLSFIVCSEIMANAIKPPVNPCEIRQFKKSRVSPNESVFLPVRIFACKLCGRRWFSGLPKRNETNCQNLTSWPVTLHTLTSQAWKIPVAFFENWPFNPNWFLATKKSDHLGESLDYKQFLIPKWSPASKMVTASTWFCSSNWAMLKTLTTFHLLIGL